MLMENFRSCSSLCLAGRAVAPGIGQAEAGGLVERAEVAARAVDAFGNRLQPRRIHALGEQQEGDGADAPVEQLEIAAGGALQHFRQAAVGLVERDQTDATAAAAEVLHGDTSAEAGQLYRPGGARDQAGGAEIGRDRKSTR